MNDESFASLTPSLLARKGAARPAMRPQQAEINMPSPAAPHSTLPFVDAMPVPEASGLDDLGWNDMGADYSAAPPAHDPLLDHELSPAPQKPVVHAQQDQILRRMRRSASPKSQRRKRGSAVAFTLRIAPDRHTKLRLACAIHNRSAQQIVTEALDALLATMPEIEPLAAQLPQH